MESRDDTRRRCRCRRSWPCGRRRREADCDRCQGGKHARLSQSQNVRPESLMILPTNPNSRERDQTKLLRESTVEAQAVISLRLA